MGLTTKPDLLAGWTVNKLGNFPPLTSVVQLWEDSNKRKDELLKRLWEFPGSPVVRTPGCHCRGPGLIPGWRTKIPQATWNGRNKNKKETLSTQAKTWILKEEPEQKNHSYGMTRRATLYSCRQTAWESLEDTGKCQWTTGERKTQHYSSHPRLNLAPHYPRFSSNHGGDQFILILTLHLMWSDCTQYPAFYSSFLICFISFNSHNNTLLSLRDLSPY